VNYKRGLWPKRSPATVMPVARSKVEKKKKKIWAKAGIDVHTYAVTIKLFRVAEIRGIRLGVLSFTLSSCEDMPCYLLNALIIVWFSIGPRWRKEWGIFFGHLVLPPIRTWQIRTNWVLGIQNTRMRWKSLRLLRINHNQSVAMLGTETSALRKKRSK